MKNTINILDQTLYNWYYDDNYQLKTQVDEKFQL